jgi:hypothetical protein
MRRMVKRYVGGCVGRVPQCVQAGYAGGCVGFVSADAVVARRVGGRLGHVSPITVTRFIGDCVGLRSVVPDDTAYSKAGPRDSPRTV